MKKLIIFFLLLICFSNSFTQSLKKYEISSTGCYVYFYCDPGTFGLDKSPDSSFVYTGECVSDDVNYGVICVQLKDQIPDINEAESVMVSYLDYLKSTLKITSSAGYGKGHRLAGHEDTRGIIDYWFDNDKYNWKIKSWTEGKFIAVLYVYTKKDIPETKANVFLNSLLLPGIN